MEDSEWKARKAQIKVGRIRLSSKDSNRKERKGWGHSSVTECGARMCEALVLNTNNKGVGRAGVREQGDHLYLNSPDKTTTNKFFL